MASTIENGLAFANRRDEAIHQVQEQMKSFIQKVEYFHKELAGLEQQRSEVIGTIDVLQAAINGLQRALSEASEKDSPVERDYNGKSGTVNVSGVVKDWHFGQR